MSYGPYWYGKRSLGDNLELHDIRLFCRGKEALRKIARGSGCVRYARGGRRRSWNQARYSLILARCVEDACRLQVAASSLRSGAPQRASTQSLRL